MYERERERKRERLYLCFETETERERSCGKGRHHCSAVTGKGRHSVLHFYIHVNWPVLYNSFTSSMYRVLGNVSNEIQCGLKIETGSKH